MVETDGRTHTTRSGIPVDAVYEAGQRPADPLPGSFPFTRGPYASMYRGRLWTMRQFAGYGTPAETNERFRLLLGHGQTGLSVAFDMPTLMGLDPDDPRSIGEVGRCGVAVAGLDDTDAPTSAARCRPTSTRSTRHRRSGCSHRAPTSG
jgi:methylmalonyl-CoA mutase N-terminal domain/subunit